MNTASIVLLLAALLIFVLAAFAVALGKLVLVPLGLAVLTAALILSKLPPGAPKV